MFFAFDVLLIAKCVTFAILFKILATFLHENNRILTATGKKKKSSVIGYLHDGAI